MPPILQNSLGVMIVKIQPYFFSLKIPTLHSLVHMICTNFNKHYKHVNRRSPIDNT